MRDVFTLSGISGLSFDSNFLSLPLFFHLILLFFLSFDSFFLFSFFFVKQLRADSWSGVQHPPLPRTYTYSLTLEAHIADNRRTLGSKLTITPWRPQRGNGRRREGTSLSRRMCSMLSYGQAFCHFTSLHGFFFFKSGIAKSDGRVDDTRMPQPHKLSVTRGISKGLTLQKSCV